jgi:hypothetical protein
MKINRLVLALCIVLIHRPVMAEAGSATACANLPVAPTALVKNASFAADLLPFGKACFVGHLVANPPSPGSSGQPDPALPIIAFSLFQNGRDIYDFPLPDDWAPAVDGIVSVAFRKLGHDGFTDVIIIGHEDGHMGDIYIPLIYRGSAHGFAADEATADNLPGNYATMPALLSAISRAEAAK